MLVFRIAKEKYIRDLSGSGSRIHGARWSPKGISVVYTSENHALAALEYYVHTSPRFVPSDLRIADISIPDTSTIEILNMAVLAPDWREYPAPLSLQGYGLNWINSGKTLILRVPSVQIKHEHNMLINPNHPEMAKVQIVNVEEFPYDDRLRNR